MAPAKQVKVIREFQKQSAQLDMTVIYPFNQDFWCVLMQVLCISGSLLF